MRYHPGEHSFAVAAAFTLSSTCEIPLAESLHSIPDGARLLPAQPEDSKAEALPKRLLIANPASNVRPLHLPPRSDILEKPTETPDWCLLQHLKDQSNCAKVFAKDLLAI